MQTEEYFDPDLFLDLPLEIQKEIIVQNPNLMRTFSRVHPHYNELLERKMVDQFCDEPFKEHEYHYINDFQPIRGTIHKKYLKHDGNSKASKIGYLIVIDQENLIVGKTITMVEIILENEIQIQAIPSQGHAAKLEFYKYNGKDYLSSYNMWTNRLNCMKMNPNYAKQKIINMLDKQEEVYKKYKDIKINFDYKNFIITIYCTVVLNKYIFNIIDQSKLSKLTNINHHIDDIKNDIEYLFKEIRNRLAQLD